MVAETILKRFEYQVTYKAGKGILWPISKDKQNVCELLAELKFNIACPITKPVRNSGRSKFSYGLHYSMLQGTYCVDPEDAMDLKPYKMFIGMAAGDCTIKAKVIYDNDCQVSVSIVQLSFFCFLIYNIFFGRERMNSLSI